ncbi:MAG: regulator of nonsense transcription [Claussenomyces sp. TS43310]|nr:MAG: regulator of nonsense transcription [Claussenomyces sp. TS43310]
MATPDKRSIPRSQANGVLPISAAQTASGATKPSTNKSSGPKLKIVVRRLAPGLTEAEFTKILGEEWNLGQGKVDWFIYKPGRDSKDVSKPSRPSRAYMHLTSETHLIALSDAVRQRSFEDNLNTWTSTALIGPPTVEFAPYGRIPSGRRRTDARQGTIDQDAEFMDFLESLINPITGKEGVEDPSGEAGPDKGQKVTTTPLVQFLKDKKANKGKESAAIKAAKQARQEAQVAKAIAKSAKETPGSTEDGKKSAKELKKERLVEKAAREAVKVLNKDSTAKTSSGQNGATVPAPSDSPKTPRALARERGSIAAAARILQRDLGLSPGNAHRKAKENAGNVARASTEAQGTSPSQGADNAPSPKVAPPQSSARGRGAKHASDKSTNVSKDSSSTGTSGPILLLKKPAEPATGGASLPAAEKVASKTSGPPARKAPPAAIPSAGATKAFVKHANPSQGVTELLLKEAMEAFGAVSHVEIDKRKGFAYVDFVDAEGLAKAMAANPTKIAQGTVQVLERKDARPSREAPSGPSNRGGVFPERGGRAGGGGGSGGGGGGRRGGRGGGRGGSGAKAAAAPAATTK